MQIIERCSWAWLITAIGFGAFLRGSGFSQTLPASGGGGEWGGGVNPLNAWFSAPAVGCRLIFPKMLTYKRAYLGVKITTMHTHPGLHHAISRFPIGAKAGDRSSSCFLKL